ncbi:LIM and cysteine-rich domains protein 1, partial [Antrostomus carolinensis]
PLSNTSRGSWVTLGALSIQAMQYMELIPKEMQPVAGTDGACYRRRQLMRQLPLEGKLKLMEDFVKKYKAEALGVGEVALPGQAGGGKEEGKMQEKTITAGKPPEATNGALERASMGEHYRCETCKQAVPGDCPVVYADRAGYTRPWHPAGFVCWRRRHYCESLRPRCAGCEEIIFSEDYQQAEGMAWHKKHFACLECETLLTGKPFTLANSSLLCTTCSTSKRL